MRRGFDFGRALVAKDGVVHDTWLEDNPFHLNKIPFGEPHERRYRRIAACGLVIGFVDFIGAWKEDPPVTCFGCLAENT